MPKASLTEVFEVEAQNLYDVIIDYHSYPDFVDGVSSVEVLEQNESGATVKYSLNLIKTFSYTLKLTHQAPSTVSWELVSGDIFKINAGAWRLKDLGDGKTEVSYELEVDLKVFAPKMIINKLVGQNLPHMMKQYIERAKSI